MPGTDRMITGLDAELDIVEINLLALNHCADDLMMQAPNMVGDARLKELRLRLALPPVKVAS